MATTKCNICKGSGECDMCYGTGITRYQDSMDIVYYSKLDDLLGKGKEGTPKKCPHHCKGTGKCKYCNGMGYV